MKRRTFIGGLAAAPVLPAPALADITTSALERQREFVVSEASRFVNENRIAAAKLPFCDYRKAAVIDSNERCRETILHAHFDDSDQDKTLAFGWTCKDVADAMKTGQSLCGKVVRRAFARAEYLKNEMFFRGDGGSMPGLLNAVDIQTAHLALSEINLGSDGATYAERGRKLKTRLEALVASDGSGFLCDTVSVPLEWSYLLSMWGFNSERNPCTTATGKRLRMVIDREGENRIVAYRNDPDVIVNHVPADLYFPDPRLEDADEEFGGKWLFPGVISLGGVEFKQPEAVKYLDLV